MGATIPILAFLLGTHTGGKSDSGLIEGEEQISKYALTCFAKISP